MMIFLTHFEKPQNFHILQNDHRLMVALVTPITELYAKPITGRISENRQAMYIKNIAQEALYVLSNSQLAPDVDENPEDTELK